MSTSSPRSFDPGHLLMRVGCFLLILMMLHIVIDVAGKYLLNAPIPGTIEIVSAYYMVGVLFLPLGEVARRRDHIYVELFTRGLSPRALTRLDRAIAFVGAASMGLVAWLTTLEAIDKTQRGEMWETADSLITIWPSRWILPVGAAVMAIYMLIEGIRGPAKRSEDAE